MKVLIVDDNATMRNIIASIIKPPADEIIECEDGAEAVTLFESAHPDWVLMDIRMKKMNGIEASEIILRKHPAAKIVFVTHYESQQFRKRASELGAKAFISKQNLNDLKEIIK